VLARAAPNCLRVEKGEHSSVDRQQSEAPELPPPLYDSLSQHSRPLGELLLVDGGIGLESNRSANIVTSSPSTNASSVSFGHIAERIAWRRRHCHARRGRPQAVDGREINVGTRTQESSAPTEVPASSLTSSVGERGDHQRLDGVQSVLRLVEDD